MNYYLDRKVKRSDRRSIEAEMRRVLPLVNYPTIGVDLYRMSELRSWIKKKEIACKVVVDNNVASILISLLYVDQSQKSKQLDAETKLVAGIAAFIVYSGIEIFPEFAHYERGREKQTEDRVHDDLMLRYVDHLHPQTLANIFKGSIRSIPEADLDYAKAAVHSNATTTESMQQHNYQDTNQPGVNTAYTHLLKAWILLQTEKNQNKRLQKYLEWVRSNSLNSKSMILFVAIFLCKDRYPKMIKNMGSNDPDKLLGSVKNAAWDLFYLGTLDVLTEKCHGKPIWCLVTRDQLLRKIGTEIFAIREESELRKYMGRFYDEEGVDLLIESKSAVRSGEELIEHIALVVEAEARSISDLECELRARLTQS